MLSRIAVVTSDVFVRRLTPALAAFVRERREFRIIDIHRPWSELRSIIRACRPEAVIVESLPTVTAAVVRLGYPTVIAVGDTMYRGAVSIDVDDAAVGVEAARFFQQSGYRHFACVHLRTAYGAQRLAGFRETLAREGHHCETFHHAAQPGRNYMESWRDRQPALREWLRRIPKPAGIFAVHDPLGRTVCEAAHEAGIQVPDEIAVVGANNDELVSGLTYPPLSSVAIPWEQIGALAGRWAQRLLDGESAPKRPLIVPPGPVVVRQSTALTAVADPELRRVLRHLRANAATDLTIASVCRALRLSRRSVERKFSALLQSTPWETLCRMRSESAKRLLVETDLPMSLVAERSGFGSAERLSVVFRRTAGMSPSASRRAARR
ncbi:MAG TPA: substrate-binding domain-containing protein [Terrimicrobiaceae bacterium]|nr:substrate-binding domain-containing protein [Terrimicrobiaceae bacterium]